MSQDDAERMISVAELLRREGLELEDERGVTGRIVATAAGVMALCGASVTGMLAFAPNLSTAFLPGDSGDVVAQGSTHASSVSATGNEAVGSGSVQRVGLPRSGEDRHPVSGQISGDLGFRAANQQVPAMSQIPADSAVERSDSAPESAESDEGSVSATTAPSEDTSEEPAEEPTKPKPGKPAEEPPPAEEAPAEDEQPPAKDEHPPAEDEAPSEEQPPAEDDESPEESEQPPAEEDSEAPSEEGQPEESQPEE